MCREFLFRGKRTDNGEWVEGDLRQDRDLGTAYISGWDYWTGEGGVEREPYEYEVDPSTVCQYTGLLDKNERKVFEKDLIVCRPRVRGVIANCCIDRGYVEFRDGAFGVHRFDPDGYAHTFLGWLSTYEYEVVGDFFEQIASN